MLMRYHYSMDSTRLYAIVPVTELTAGDRIFCQDSERIVTSTKGRAPANIRIASIQAAWPYLSVVNVHEPEDEVPACQFLCTWSGPNGSPVLKRYDNGSGLQEAAEAKVKYENRTP